MLTTMYQCYQTVLSYNDGINLFLTHACVFNSVTSVYSAMYIDHSTMRSEIDSSTSKYAEFIKLLFQHQQINSKIEFARYEFLKEIFSDRTAIKEINYLISFSEK